MRHLYGSLRLKIIFSLVTVVTLVMGTFQYFSYQSLQAEYTDKLNTVADQKIDRLSRDLDIPLWELDEHWIQTILQTEMIDERVHTIMVEGDENIYEEKKRDLSGLCYSAGYEVSKECIVREAPILHNGVKIGSVKFYLSKSQMQGELREKIVETLWLALIIAVIIVGGLGFTMDISVLRPLEKLLYATQHIARGNYDYQIEEPSRDEIGLLGRSIEEMKLKIGTREKELKESRSTLESMNATLELKVKERTQELSDANQKLQELDKLKSMFIASMSHELRTPLNSIIGFTGVILQGLSGPLNEKQSDQLQRVKSAGQHLLTLISDVIDISKIEAGRVTAAPETFGLEEIMEEAYGEIEILARQKGLEIRLEPIPQIEMFTDKKRVYQCMLNYLSNAVKFTESGKIVFGARDEGESVRIWVQDSGVGIAKKDQSRLFEAFERLETHMRVLPGGTGLGLYLTRKITEQILEGSVWFESTEGVGSTFGLVIPKKIREREEQ